MTVTDRTFELPGGGGGNPPDRPRFPGDLIPVHWKLTTTLGPEEDPLEIWRDGHTELDGRPVDLDTYVHPNHWRLTDEQQRWGIKITCPAKGSTTGGSENTRWELRGLNQAGTRTHNFRLSGSAPILDTEVCVLDLQGNHAVLSQIHGQDTDGENDDLTVWRAEPNRGRPDYTLWLTVGDDPNVHKVDGAVPYGKVIHIGFRPADGDRVRYVYNGRVLDHELQARYSTDNYYKAGLYLQIKAGPQSKGTIILYKAEVTWRQ